VFIFLGEKNICSFMCAARLCVKAPEKFDQMFTYCPYFVNQLTPTLPYVLGTINQDIVKDTIAKYPAVL